MHIYIDESGIFNNPDKKGSAPSCVGALIIPTSKKKEVFKEFDALKHRWGKSGQEVKGSKLDESQVAAVVALLQKYDVLFEVSTIDMALHPDEALTEYKKVQTEQITASITPAHQPHVVKQANEIKAAFQAMSIPLFVQAFLMLYLIPRVLLHGVLYYARRIPEELQWFYWQIDAKETQSLLDYEKAWSTIIYVTMSTQSLNNPISFVEGGDYSYLDKFYKDVSRDAETLTEMGLDPDELKSINLGKILGEHRAFQDSKTSLGLQLADILVTSTRRALRGNLGQAGWENIGRLIINKQITGKGNGIHPIMINLQKAKENTTVPITTAVDVYKTYLSKGKSILRFDEM
ncbi:MAG: DUF3800 domain-containing protein [Pyrinomonadaceae bacterium]